MTTHEKHIPWYLWPFAVIWKLLTVIVELTGRLVAMILGIVLMLVGGIISLTVIGAIVGAAGEAEHGALWHVPGGYAMRELLGESRAIVPSAMKVGAMGATLDVPLGHINAAYVRSHFDAMTVSMPDGPRADEILLVLAAAGAAAFAF